MVSNGMDFSIAKSFFSERLKTLRLSQNLSQETLATALGKGKSAISMMESAQSSATADTLIALADYFNVSLDYLVGRSDNPELIRKDDSNDKICI